MIGTFLKERLSWIGFVFFIHGVILLVGYLDTTLPFRSILYPLLLTAVCFLLFLVFRYRKETAYYQALKDINQSDDLLQFPHSHSPFEDIVAGTMSDQRTVLVKRYMEKERLMDNEKDELLAWIHEVKTPLTTMGLVIDRLEDRQLRETIHYEWMRIHLLLDQQLYQKRMAFIENDLFMETVDLLSLLHTEIKSFQTWCVQKGIGIQLDLVEEKVTSDAKWLSFLLRQILSNAIKYSSQGEIVIRSSELNGQVVVTIQDEGIGIEAKDLIRIKEKGFTSTTHHQEQAASGMGLYLADKVAEALHMELLIESEVKRGTTITLVFPNRNSFSSVQSM